MWLTIAEEQTWPETLKIYKTHKYSNVTAIVDNKVLIIALNLDLTQKLSFLLSLTGIKNIHFEDDISRSTNLRLRCFFSCFLACCSLLLALPVSFDSIFLQNDVRRLNKEDARTHTHFTVKLALGGKISCWGFVFVICSFYLLSAAFCENTLTLHLAALAPLHLQTFWCTFWTQKTSCWPVSCPKPDRI